MGGGPASLPPPSTANADAGGGDSAAPMTPEGSDHMPPSPPKVSASTASVRHASGGGPGQVGGSGLCIRAPKAEEKEEENDDDDDGVEAAWVWGKGGSDTGTFPAWLLDSPRSCWSDEEQDRLCRRRGWMDWDFRLSSKVKRLVTKYRLKLFCLGMIMRRHQEIGRK